jgi:hypothetical protein
MATSVEPTNSYATPCAKRKAVEETPAADGNVEAYNAHKQAAIREIYGRAFTALGLA